MTPELVSLALIVIPTSKLELSCNSFNSPADFRLTELLLILYRELVVLVCINGTRWCANLGNAAPFHLTINPSDSRPNIGKII